MLQQHALAGARRAEDDRDDALGDRHVEPVEHLVGAERLVQAARLDRADVGRDIVQPAVRGTTGASKLTARAVAVSDREQVLQDRVHLEVLANGTLHAHGSAHDLGRHRALAARVAPRLLLGERDLDLRRLFVADDLGRRAVEQQRDVAASPVHPQADGRGSVLEPEDRRGIARQRSAQRDVERHGGFANGHHEHMLHDMSGRPVRFQNEVFERLVRHPRGVADTCNTSSACPYSMSTRSGDRPHELEPEVDRAIADRLASMLKSHRQLRECTAIGDLFARAAGAAADVCGFDRAIVLTVADRSLSAAESGRLADPDSDRLRRRALSQPVAIEPTPRRARSSATPAPPGAPGARRAARSPTHSRRFGPHVYAAVAPEAVVLALLVLDRNESAPTPAEIVSADVFAGILAVAIERVVLRLRVGELSAEVRQFAASAQALAREVREAPVTLPRDGGLGPAFPPLDLAPARESAPVRSIFSEREQRVAALLIEGRSNREIAELLVLSPETVKTHVARILRKLGAANRVEAVTRYLRLAQEQESA